jgi:electron transport complex protein RnfB
MISEATRSLLQATASVGAIGLACGGALAAAARFLSVKEDPRILLAEDCLPGINCGGCGYAGCAEFAKAVILEGADISLCAPGGETTLHALAKLMGQEASAKARTVAMVHCGGSVTQAGRRHLYNGVADCKAAAAVGGGDKTCTYGCLGYASCVNACPCGGIAIIDGVAIVNPDLCIGCGKCTRECPRNLITMIPADATVHVLCSSKDKGPIVKKGCKVGCIGCRLCAKFGGDAFKIDSLLATRDYTIEVNETETVVAKCPGKCIVDTAEAKPQD